MSLGLIYDPRKSPTSIASDLISIDLDVMSDEAHDWSNEVTENPVELGAPVADHIQPNADKLSITGLITNAPIDPDVAAQFPGSIDGGLFSARLQTHFDWLRELTKLRMPLTVYTRYKVYTDMAITSCNISRSTGTGEALPFTLQFINIRLVKTQTVDVPPGISSKLDKKADKATANKSQPEAKGGKKDTKEAREAQKSTLLKSISGSITGGLL
jgi:hypothetical protein